MIRLNVPEFCSELMASKPSPIPNKGPRNPIKTWKGGREPSDNVNSFKKKKGSSASLAFRVTSTRFVMDVYNDPKQVRRIRNSKTLKRQLRTWSEMSFRTISQKG